MKIIYGPPGDSSNTEWFTAHPDDPRSASETLWLTPTQRKRAWTAGRFRDYRRLHPPRLHTFDELSLMLYRRLGGSRRPVPAAVMQYLLLAVVQDPEIDGLLKQWMSMRPGPGFIQEIVRQIDALQRHGIGVDELMAIPDAADGIGAVFIAVYKHLDALMQTHGLIDTGGAQIAVARMLRDPNEHPALPWKTCVLDGFLELTPLQMDILSGLDTRMDLTLLWPGNPVDGGILSWMVAGLKTAFPAADWEPFTPETATLPGTARAGHLLGSVSPDALPDDIVPRDGTGVLRICERETIRDELTELARDIKQKLIAGDCRPGDIALTFPDLQAYAPAVRRLFHRYGIPVNISQSLPLTGSPVFSAIDRLLRLPGAWLRDDVLALVSDPLLTGWPGPVSRHRVRKLLEWSADRKIVRGYDSWINGLRRVQDAPEANDPECLAAADILEVLHRIHRLLGDAGPRDLSAWINWLRDLLIGLELNRRLDFLQKNIPGSNPGDDAHFEYTRRAYNRLLTYFDDLDTAPPLSGHAVAISLTEFRAVLPRLLTGVNYQLTTRSGDRVQVLGMLGIRGLTFQHVYFGGLTETAFPAADPISPFWSPELTDILMERPAQHNRVRAFADLIRIVSVPTVSLTISRPCRSGDEPLQPSPLWDFILALFSDHANVEPGDQPLSTRDRLIQWSTMPETHSGIPAPGPETPACAGVLITRAVAGSRETGQGLWCGDLRNITPAVETLLADRTGPNHRFSASQLELFLDCPRRFFFERVLRLSEPEIPVEELSPLERGNLVHATLDGFYRERLKTNAGRITPGEIESCTERIRNIAREIFDDRGYTGDAARRQLLDIVGRPDLNDPGIAHRFASHEAEGSPALQPAHLEWVFGQAAAVPPLRLSDRDGHPIRITGKIDRIDRCDDELVIWDYKSGHIPSASDIRGLIKIQVGLYMLAAGQILGLDTVAGGYYQVRGRTPLLQKTALRLRGSRADAHLPDPGRANSLDRVWRRDEFDDYFRTLEQWISECVSIMRSGWFSIRKDISNCDQCPFAGACRPGKEMEYVPV